jgi:DNA-binding PucR family transcriptional regulator
MHPLLPTPETISKVLKGTIHYASVSFTETGFEEQEKVTFGGRDFEVAFIKAKNPNFVKHGEFLKSFKS